MPSRTRVSGGAQVTSLPSKRIAPVVGSVSPARQLKKVDLPAPFGPIRPTISPWSTAKFAPATARKSPNAFATFSASSSMGAFPERLRRAMPQIEQPARLETRDQDDNAAIDNVGQSGAAAAEQRIRRGLQRDQDQRADQRTEQSAGAAERGDDHHLHRDQNAEAGIGTDGAGLDHVKRARDRGEGGGWGRRAHVGL